MKLILIILLACGSAGLLPATLEASDRKPIYNLTIVESGMFYGRELLEQSDRQGVLGDPGGEASPSNNARITGSR